MTSIVDPIAGELCVQRRFVAGIQCRQEAVEYSECRGYRSLVRLRPKLVDSDGPSPSGGP